MRPRDHILNPAENEVLDLLEMIGIPRDQQVVAATITVDPDDRFSFAVTHKTGGYGLPVIYDDARWSAVSSPLRVALVESLGFAPEERLRSIKIHIGALGKPVITITKHADDRLLDLGWSLVARKQEQ